MDTTQPSFISHSLSPSDLAAQLRAAGAPLLLDVRKAEAFAASACQLPGALRRDPVAADDWAPGLAPAASVVVYCVHGHEVSQTTAAVLRRHGIQAHYLQGGIEAWRQQMLPLNAKPVGTGSCWVTRERPRIDRIACPWLILRFIDASARFLYVPASQVAAVAEREMALPYDVMAQVASTPLTHDGEHCSFDAFVRHYRLNGDKALVHLARIVRGADTHRPDLSPSCEGLLAVSLGMARIHTNDHAMLNAMLPVYDALYAWCRDAVTAQDEQHNWNAA